MISRFVMIALILATSFYSPTVTPSSSNDLIKVEVATLLVNEGERSILLVLKPEQAETKLVLPLVIGMEEARSISIVFHGLKAPRPLTHDLMKTVIEEYGGSIVSCVITKMERDTFFAEIRLKRAGKEFSIDARPSDAIALALRAGVPIYVRRSVINDHGVDPNKPEKVTKPLKT